MALKIAQNTEDEVVFARSSWVLLGFAILICVVSLAFLSVKPSEIVLECQGGIAEGTCEYKERRPLGLNFHRSFSAVEIQRDRTRNGESEMGYIPLIATLQQREPYSWSQWSKYRDIIAFQDETKDHLRYEERPYWILDNLGLFFLLFLGFFVIALSRFGTIRLSRSMNWCSVHFRGITGRYAQEINLDDLLEVQWQRLGPFTDAGRPVLLLSTGPPIVLTLSYHSTRSETWRVFKLIDKFLKDLPDPGEGEQEPPEIEEDPLGADIW